MMSPLPQFICEYGSSLKGSIWSQMNWGRGQGEGAFSRTSSFRKPIRPGGHLLPRGGEGTKLRNFKTRQRGIVFRERRQIFSLTHNLSCESPLIQQSREIGGSKGDLLPRNSRKLRSACSLGKPAILICAQSLIRRGGHQEGKANQTANSISSSSQSRSSSCPDSRRRRFDSAQLGMDCHTSGRFLGV
jgi:hypothetical protein